jgi:hypothetical protein
VAYEPGDGGAVQVFDNVPWSVQSWRSSVPPAKAFFGYGPPGDSASYGYCAFHCGESWWRICSGRSETEVHVPQSFQVHGVIRVANYEETLIVVEEDLQTLSLHGVHGTRRLVKAQAPIVAVSGCQQLPFIAYASEAGEIAVYSLKHDKPVLDFQRSAQ